MSFFQRWIENHERAMLGKVLIQLKELPENHLTVAGISADLLEHGVDAWPWRAPDALAKTASAGVVKDLFGEQPQTAADTSSPVHGESHKREFETAA